MIDLKEYDKGVAGYLNKLKLSVLPLHSWDFYGSFFQSLSYALTDAKRLHTMATDYQWNLEVDVKKELENDTVIIVTDTRLQIVFSSQNMIKMNGYKQEEVIGKSPKMFQGKDTSKQIAAEIREAITNKAPFEKKILNYCKNGDPYYCWIKGFPVFNTEGQLSHFIALEKAA
ncbi:MAG TPA: PAS domain-containing protein [Flavobacterium sp.]|jgi:PAS domain S-box-containing protein